jgi:hypothetical protein
VLTDGLVQLIDGLKGPDEPVADRCLGHESRDAPEQPVCALRKSLSPALDTREQLVRFLKLTRTHNLVIAPLARSCGGFPHRLGGHGTTRKSHGAFPRRLVGGGHRFILSAPILVGKAHANPYGAESSQSNENPSLNLAIPHSIRSDMGDRSLEDDGFHRPYGPPLGIMLPGVDSSLQRARQVARHLYRQRFSRDGASGESGSATNPGFTR